MEGAEKVETIGEEGGERVVTKDASKGEKGGGEREDKRRGEEWRP